MPKMQVYLPDDLYEAVKELDLPASGLLQEAVRGELHRRQLEAAAWGWVHDVEASQGAPTDRELAAARRWVEKLG